MTPIDLPAGGSLTQHYLVQPASQNSGVLPDIRSSEAAEALAAAYQSGRDGDQPEIPASAPRRLPVK